MPADPIWTRLTPADVERAHREAEAEVGIVRPPTRTDVTARMDRELCEVFGIHSDQCPRPCTEHPRFGNPPLLEVGRD